MLWSPPWIFIRKYNLLGTPETKRKGLRTRNALNALTSKPSICRVDRIVDTTLKKVKKKKLNLSSTFSLVNAYKKSKMVHKC